MSNRAHPPIVSGPYRMLHGGDYNPEQWLHRPEILEQDAKLMREAGVNEASVGIFAWAAIEPERDRFEFAWLDQVMDRLQAHGVGVILATPIAARPRWLAEAHPEVMRTRRDGVRLAPGHSRHNPCWTSAVLRERSAIVIDRLAARYAGHPALVGWHLDNEFGGDEDNARCYCDGCVAGFRSWLRTRYDGDLDRLNRAWWTAFWSHQYQSWEQIRPGDFSVEALGLNWNRYTSSLVADFCGHQLAAVRRHSAAPATTNLHGDLDQYDVGALCRQLDFTSFDAYHEASGTQADIDDLHHFSFLTSAVRAFGGGKPWLLMESCPSLPQWKPRQRLKRSGVHRLNSLSMVAEGSDGVCYFQWRAGRGAHEKLHGAVLMQDAPSDTRVFREVAALGSELRSLSAIAGAATPSSAAVVWDVHSEWARGWNSGLYSVERPRANAHAWHRPLWAAGIGCDVVDATRDLNGYRIVVVPGVFLLRPGFAERLQAAAESGVQVVIDGLSAWLDDDMACVAGGRPGPLREALGLRCEEFDQLRDDERQALADPDGWLGSGATACGWIDRIHAEGCEVLVRAVGGFHDGQPLLTRRGNLWYVAAGLDGAARAHLLRRLCARIGVSPCLPDLPAGVIARERTQPGRRFVFLLNPTAAHLRVTPGPGWKNVNDDTPVVTVELPSMGAVVISQ